MIVRLKNTIRHYAWGSHDGIARFMGREELSTAPEAEMWIGAHPDDPSSALVEPAPVPLNTLIARTPDTLLGSRVSQRFGGTLPYLMKVLAAEAPLSLQAHPTIEQAKKGYDDEERRGIPHGSPKRNYRDRNHKPELIYATTPFEGFCGFRAPLDIAETFERLNQPSLVELAKRLRAEPNSLGIKKLLEYLLVAPSGKHDNLIRQTLEAALQGQPQESPDHHHLRWIIELAKAYPGDVGIVTALLLNYVALKVGQAIFLPARSLHSYLKGVGIEIMASSDNVLRGGLTPKHVDAAELLRVLSFESIAPPIMTPTTLSSVEKAFITPAADFRLSIISIDGTYHLSPQGPELLLCGDGSVTLSARGEDTVILSRGESAFVGAEHQAVSITGQGQLFRATVGEL
jgi:mannose-6-phosphate isomerase